MSHKTTFLNAELYEYLLEKSLREPKVLQELRQVTSQMTSSVMQIAAEQGQFMSMLIRLLGAKKTLELGVYTGYSALCVALALPKDGKVIACDINEEWTTLAKEYWEKAKVHDKIELNICPAKEFLTQLLDNNQQDSFDFAFIDADKQNYIHYYEQCLKLVKPGGMIMVDNVLWEGDVVDQNNNTPSTQTIRLLNEIILEDERVHISMLPIGDGITLALKR